MYTKHELYLQLDYAQLALQWANTADQEDSVQKQIEQIEKDIANFGK
jgi:hypothetical protein